MKNTPKVKFFGVFFLFVICGSSLAGGPIDCPPGEALQYAFVKSVQDGDTLTLMDNRRVRLVGINASELGGHGSDDREAVDQPFAQAARKALIKLAPPGSRIGLLRDKSTTDRYGRWLYHLYDAQDRSIEAQLLWRGVAWHVAVPPDLGQADCLAEAENRARKLKLGLWGPAGIPAVAAGRIDRGGYKRVRGRVVDVAFRDAWWIEFDGEASRHFSAVVYPENQKYFDKSKIAGWLGEEIEVQGWVYSTEKNRPRRWRMRLETPWGVESTEP